MEKITVQDNEIRIITNNNDDYISLTDMAKSQLQEHIIFRWLSLKVLSNILVNGRCCIIQTLIVPNSV